MKVVFFASHVSTSLDVTSADARRGRSSNGPARQAERSRGLGLPSGC